jgi:hypothetical protein
MLSALTENELEDYVLANDPEFVEGMRLADEEFRQGLTRPLEDVLKELD